MSRTTEDTFQKPNERILPELRDIQGELGQLSDLDEADRSYAMKLVEQLKQIQSAVSTVLPLPKEVLPDTQQCSHAKEAWLAVDAVVVLVDETDKHISIPLSKFEPNNIFAIVTHVAPLLKKAISEKRRVIGERVEVMIGASKILREVKKAAGPQRNIGPMDDDVAESSLPPR